MKRNRIARLKGRCPICGGKLAVANTVERHRRATKGPMLQRSWSPIPADPRPDDGIVCESCGQDYRICPVIGSPAPALCACGTWFWGVRIPVHLAGYETAVEMRGER